MVATCDPDRTEQVLHTLLANACPVARSAVEVTVRRVSGGDGRGAVELEVRDDGPGSAAAALAGLFEPVPSPGRGNVGGRGLGLYVSREVARAQGGDLALEDTDSGGTTFLLTLREES